MFSPENQPHQLHVAKLVEKFARKPFGEGPQERLSPAELKAGMFHVESAFSFLRVSKEFAAVPSLDSVLDGCQRVLQKWMDDFSMTADSPNWKCGVVIDPWNEMDHGRPNNMSETEYISSCLSVIRQFARDWNIHIWLVAHPAKLQKDKDNNYPVARLWDISGSALGEQVRCWNNGMAQRHRPSFYGPDSRPEGEIPQRRETWACGAWL